MIYGKSQISLAASEIYYLKRTWKRRAFCQIWQRIADYLQISVDLPEFSVMFRYNFARLVHDAQAYQKIARVAVGDDIVLVLLCERSAQLSEDSRLVTFGFSGLEASICISDAAVNTLACLKSSFMSRTQNSGAAKDLCFHEWLSFQNCIRPENKDLEKILQAA